MPKISADTGYVELTGAECRITGPDEHQLILNFDRPGHGNGVVISGLSTDELQVIQIAIDRVRMAKPTLRDGKVTLDVDPETLTKIDHSLRGC